MRKPPLIIYLAAAPADRGLADLFRRGLAARGLFPCLGLNLLPASHAAGAGLASDTGRQAVRDALRRAAGILVLVGPERRPTDAQRCERQAVLEAVWSDPGKLLVPVLLGRAVLPSFLRSVYPADHPIAVYRLRRPRTALPRAVADLAAVLRGTKDLAAVGQLLDTAAEDRFLRLQGLADVRRLAESLPS